jgi:hypothetical protein
LRDLRIEHPVQQAYGHGCTMGCRLRADVAGTCRVGLRKRSIGVNSGDGGMYASTDAVVALAFGE